MSHTPGPWIVGIAPEEPLPTYLIGTDGVIFCRVVGSPSHDAEANARLIASAPRLERQLTAAIRELEACRHLIHDHADGWGGKAFEALERIEAADAVLKEAKQ